MLLIFYCTTVATWRTWHWELESGGAMARWQRKGKK